jgi:hypothetical protein
MTPANPDYPVRLEVDYPERLSRLLIFVKWLLAIPLYIEAFVLGIALYITVILAFFAVLFTGRYPEGLWNFLVGVERFRQRVSAYLFLQVDRYPPFGLADDPSYPVRLQAAYPPRIAGWRPLVNWLLAIPVFIGAALIGIIAWIGAVIAWFAILFTGRYPQALFDIVTIGLRWNARATLFALWGVEQYPPFVWA